MELHVSFCSGEGGYVFVGGGPAGEGRAGQGRAGQGRKGAIYHLSAEGREAAEEVAPQLLMGAGS